MPWYIAIIGRDEHGKKYYSGRKGPYSTDAGAERAQDKMKLPKDYTTETYHVMGMGEKGVQELRGKVEEDIGYEGASRNVHSYPIGREG